MPYLRSILFWRAVQERREEFAVKDERLTDWWLVSFMIHELVGVRLDDFDMFLKAIFSRDSIDDRLVALTAAFAVWCDAGRPRKDRQRMCEAVKGELELETKLHALLNPGPMSDKLKRWRRQERDYKRRRAKRCHEEGRRAFSTLSVWQVGQIKFGRWMKAARIDTSQTFSG